jgi:ubiquitin C-terminal hydrolase
MSAIFHKLSTLFRDKSDPHGTAPRHVVFAGALGLSLVALSVGKIAYDEIRDYWSIGKPQDLSFDTPMDDEKAKQGMHISHPFTFPLPSQSHISPLPSIEFSVSGLRSFGLTCFLNATIQALCASPRFEAHIRRAMPYINTDKLATSLFQLLCARYPDITTFYTRVKRNARLAYFADGREHDAQEFLVCLLQELEDAVARGHKAVRQREHELQQQREASSSSSSSLSDDDADASNAMSDAPAEADLNMDDENSSSSSSSPPSLPLLGAETSFRRCRTCNVTQTASSPLAVLSLSLFETRGASIDLRQLFDTYTVIEQLSDVTCDWCTASAIAKQASAYIADLATVVEDETEGSFRDAQLDALLEGPLPGLTEDDESNTVMYHRLVAQLRRANLQMNKINKGSVSYKDLPSKAPGALSVDEEELLLRHAPAWAPLVPNKPVKTRAERQILVSEFPPVLCVHFKRLIGDHKIDSHVNFPLDLDMSTFQQLYHTKMRQTARGGVPMSLGNSQVRYKLAAVVVHHGSAYGGHYVTYRRAGRTFGSESKGRARVSVVDAASNTQLSVYGEVQIEKIKGQTVVSGASGDLCTSDAYVERQSIVGAPVKGDALCDASFGSDDDVWWFCSDSTVYPVKIDAVLGQSAYMLTYERV